MKPPFRAAFVQFDIKRGRIGANLKTVLKALDTLAGCGVRLAVLPEVWTTSFIAAEAPRLVAESADAIEAVRAAARCHKMVVAGSCYEKAGKTLYNTVTVIDADGSIAGKYRKIHLFSPGDEHKTFSEGKSHLVVDTAAGRLGVTVCYDLRFPELYRRLAAEGAQILIVPAQWPRERQYHWETLLRARAIENQVFVIGCNRVGTDRKSDTLTLKFNGASAIIDPWGRVLAERKGRAGALHAEIDLTEIERVRKLIPVWRDRRPRAYGPMP